LDEPTEVAEREQPVSSQLSADIAFLQWEKGLATWHMVVCSDEDTSDITDPHVISCLKEAYFSLQERHELFEVHTRFVRRYMRHLLHCPLDDRFDPAIASVIFGENYEFFVNVCRAFQTWHNE
jgi:hypothetical protein